MTDFIRPLAGGNHARIDVYPMTDGRVQIICVDGFEIVWNYTLTEDERVTLIQALLKED